MTTTYLVTTKPGKEIPEDFGGGNVEIWLIDASHVRLAISGYEPGWFAYVLDGADWVVRYTVEDQDADLSGV